MVNRASPSGPRRILLTQATLFSIAGSEMATFELADYFRSVGDDVRVVTYGVGGPWTSEFAKLGVPVHRFDDPALDAVLEDFDPEIVWIHHQVVPSSILRRAEGRRFVFHHMSVTHPMEFPLEHVVETALAGAVACVSAEALEFHRGTGLLAGVADERWCVLGNPAPLAYFERPGEPAVGPALMISNHPPAELIEALERLPVAAFERIGDHASGTSRRIGPADIGGASAVVSIGKSVQYSLAMGVPAYVYDHFGGPGWLTEDNFALARFHNFSGRGFGQKSADTIAAELLQVPAAARSLSREAATRFADTLRIDAAVERVIALAEPSGHVEFTNGVLVAFEQQMALRNGLMNAIEARDRNIEYLSQQLDISGAASTEHPPGQFR